jgi:tRNA(Ile)-lysidine synthase
MAVLTERVCRTIERFGLFSPGARVLVAASGGADSTALVYLLRGLEGRIGIELAGLAHFNHGLRGAAADEDERFCRDLAGRLGLAFDAGRGDVRAAARAGGASIEEAGRRLRYEFLAAARSRAGASHVALGHTRDDQAETVLMNLLRGAGTLGLGGMPVSRGAFVRPLVECRHAELVEYLNAAGVPFHEDESNRDPRHLRNRIRHEVLPALEKVAPAVREGLGRAAESARADAEYLDRLAAGRLTDLLVGPQAAGLTLDAAGLTGLPLALARRAAGLALRRVSGGRFVGFDQVERLLALARGEVTGPISLPGARASLGRTGRLRLAVVAGRGQAVEPEAGPPRTFSGGPLSIPGEVLLGAGRSLSSELRQLSGGSFDAASAARSATTAVVDAARVSALSVRFRRPGDRFRPLGLGGRKKLQDFFVDRRVPRDGRDLVPLVVDRDDRIVWVAGHAISEEFRVTGRTRAVVILRLRGD